MMIKKFSLFRITKSGFYQCPMLHLQTPWHLVDFHPISFCNTYGLHLLKTDNSRYLLILDINGTAYWINECKTINLKGQLGEPEKNYADFDLELVASDSFLHEEKCIYLATCWIVYDHLFAPERHFAAIFQISLDSLNSKLAKFDLENVPTYTRLTKTPPINDDGKNKLYWLVFAYSKGNCAYSVETGNERVEPVERIGDIFPFLDIQDLPGSVIRSYCAIIDNYRLSLVGYDTGYVIASVCLMENGTIIDRKTLKFDGPISVLQIIDTKVNDDSKCIMVLISSTIGPVTVWELLLQEDTLHWRLSSVLLESELYDTVLTAATFNQLIFIGTYGELLLIYDMADALKQNEISPIHTVNLASPILSILPSEADNELLILSNKGLHRLKPTLSDKKEANFNVIISP